MRRHIANSDAPSILPASISSSGIVKKYCRMMKMYSALPPPAPKNSGTTSGRYVFCAQLLDSKNGVQVNTFPSTSCQTKVFPENSTNSGRMRTTKGTMRPLSTSMNRTLRPGNLKRAKA